jgi:hypothetical protein
VAALIIIFSWIHLFERILLVSDNKSDMWSFLVFVMFFIDFVNWMKFYSKFYICALLTSTFISSTSNNLDDFLSIYILCPGYFQDITWKCYLLITKC